MPVPDLDKPSQSAPAAHPAVARRPGLILAFLCVAQFMVFLDVSIVNVALPSIQRTLGISESTLPYVVTAYGTVLGGCLLFGSRLADTFGRRRLLQAGLAVFGTASLMAGLAPAPTVLFVARGVQGLGSALIAPAALSALTTTFAEGAERNKALGIWGSLTGIASVCGVVFGGLLAQGPGWRWIFFINVPVAAAAVALAPSVLPESRAAAGRRRFDTGGAVVLTGGLLLLIYTLDEAISTGWGQARIVGGLLGAGVLLLGFVLIEARAEAPLVPFGVFKLPALRTANIATVFLLGCVTTLFFFASLFLQQVLGYSALRTGMAYVPLAVIVAVGAGLASGLVTRVAAKPVLGVGLVLAAGGLFLLWRLPVHAGYVTDVLPAFLVVGLGIGMSFVPLQVAAQIGVEEQEAGLAAGLINTSQELGGALGLAVAATVAFSRIPELTRAAHGDPVLVQAGRTSVFHQGFLVGVCFAVAAIVIAMLLPPMKALPNTDPTPAGP
jgi:EmrB/QacA subfamily drug resistance transporter